MAQPVSTITRISAWRALDHDIAGRTVDDQHGRTGHVVDGPGEEAHNAGGLAYLTRWLVTLSQRS